MEKALSEHSAILDIQAQYARFAKEINQSAYFKHLLDNNRSYRHILRFIGNLTMFGALLAGELALSKADPLSSFLVFPAYFLLQTGVIFSFMVHSHELSHNHIKTKCLNDTVGVVSGFFIGLNFYSFQHAHRLHHVNIGNLDSPEIGAPVSLKGRRLLGKIDIHHSLLRIFTKSRFAAYLITWPLHLFFGDYASWALPFREKGGIHFGSLICFLGLLAFNAALFAGLGLGYFFLYLAPAFLAGVFTLMLTFLHHAHEDTVFFNTKNHRRDASMMFTTDRDYGLIGNFFMLNNGFHIAHHLNPKIAYYDLKNASRYLRQKLPAGLKYNYYANSNLYLDFVQGIYEQRLDHNPEIYRLKYSSP